MENLSKITIELKSPTWHGYSTESLWAEDMGEQKFKIRNIPFYAIGLSIYDVVFAEFKENLNCFKSVVQTGGHSTYRIMIGQETSMDRFLEFWKPLEDIGCMYEKARGSLFAIDIPPTTDIHIAYKFLEDGFNAKIWDFEEANVGHPLSS